MLGDHCQAPLPAAGWDAAGSPPLKELSCTAAVYLDPREDLIYRGISQANTSLGGINLFKKTIFSALELRL